MYCLLAYRCTAQLELSPEQIDVSATRSGNNVLTFFEDSRGFMWCGTMESLVRYDGFSIKKYNYGKNEGEIRIESIAEDLKGNIWCASSRYGLMLLPLEKNGFANIILPSFNKTIPKAAKIVFDRKGNLWGISQLNELFTINMADSSVVIWPVQKTGSLNFLGFTNNGSLWISGRRGAFCINDFNTYKLQQVLDTAVNIAVTENNSAYFYAQNSIYKAEENREKKAAAVLLAKMSSTFSGKRPEHLITVATSSLTPFLVTAILNQPFQLIDKVTGASSTYLFAGNHTLKYEVHSCYFSSAGKLYIGTNQGFFIVEPGNKLFQTHKETGVKMRCVTSVSEDTLLLGTQGQGILQYIRNSNGQWIKGKNKPVINSEKISGFTINRFYKDSSRRLWAGANGGLFYKDNNNWKFVFEGASVWGITQDDSGNFWLGTNSLGLVKFNPGTKKADVIAVRKIINAENDKDYNRIWSTHFYKGKVYLGTASGFIEFDPGTNTFTELFEGKFRDAGIWDFFISDSVWVIPTQGKGLWVYTPQNNELKQVETVQNYFYGLQWCENNSIWVISDKGVLVSPWKGEKPFNFDANDGLNTNYFSFTGITATENGDVVLCGEDGFTIADVDGALKNGGKNVPGSLFISSLKYSGISQADFLPDGSAIELEYGKGQLLLEWTASNFQQNKHQVYYKLEGVDENWNISNVENKINYTNLLPGTYIFTAYASGQHNPYHLAITIVPPFWLTTWFKGTILVVVIIILLYIIYSWVARQKLKHARLKSEIDALRAQINPHFVFNVLNSIQAHLYGKGNNEANEYLAKFANLMRRILENSREEIITLYQERNFLELYLEMEALRFRGNLKYEVILAENCNPGLLKIPSMLVQPLVENALKYGISDENPRLQVNIYFSYENNTLTCEVADNGKGFEQHEENFGNKNSLGLKLVSERLFTLSKIYGKEYSIIAGNNTSANSGAVVKLIIPQP